MSPRQVVLTSYGTVATEWSNDAAAASGGEGGGGARRKAGGGGGGGGGLFRVSWRRVVLDEAHEIKNHSSQSARAVFALRAERRWVVTGTPLQNRLSELYASRSRFTYDLGEVCL